MGVAAAFVLFRIFDVLKPFPADRCERLRGGWGVMLDDVVAGLYGHAALRLIGWAAPGWILA
jgi:phosphatidylglycerophosphatase A